MEALPYDRIAAEYDAHWSVHVADPQVRLTEQLRLASGLRCADIGCGTGVDTVDMLKRVTPGQVLAVDPSRAMLAVAAQRARQAGLALETLCASAEEFVQRSPEHGFDVVTLRFTLGYLDWRAALPRLARQLRPGGRLGILTILASSAPQAYAVYGEMVRELNLPAVALSGAPSVTQIVEQLSGCAPESTWTQSLRLRFATGEQLAQFLRESGIATHPLLAALPAPVERALWQKFAERIEAYREPGGIPLDFDLGGVVVTASK
ncbi:MAG: methyltransferase domain-containing protein [Polyangiales bacterium]